MKRIGKKPLAPAMAFVLLMGIVSMFSDMTHEGAKSIYGAYLALAGASAATIGFVSGLGELVGYTFRLAAGFFTDKKKNYWTMAIIGYVFNMAAIPALALVPRNGWMLACGLIVLERMGKAIRYPAKNTLVSFAAAQLGEGKSFAIQEFLDQLGAFLGPVILFLVLLVRKGQDLFSTYALCFAVLGIPATATLAALFLAKRKYPDPEKFDVSRSNPGRLILPRSFFLYMAAISFLALGFVDFPLITMHVSRLGLVPGDTLPLLYAGTMIADAFAALAFGWLFDKIGLRALMISCALTASFALFIFGISTLPAVALGILLWGVGMGAQESILKSVVASIVPRERRSSGFGIFQTMFGVSWFLGSWMMGTLYDINPVWLAVFSVASQAFCIPLLVITRRARGKETAVQVIDGGPAA